MHVPVTPLGIEKVLHGHLPAADDDTGLIVFRLDPTAADSATSAPATCSPRPPSWRCPPS